MKKSFFTMALAMMTSFLSAQQPVITYERMSHDFGKINEADGRVTTVFEFKNEGMEPLVLSNVKASCGCTTPKWTREPIEPGQKGEITVTYNPNGRPGRFTKTITVTSNATEPSTKLTIKGEVIPKPAKPANQYNVKIGELSLKSDFVNFGSVKMGDKAERELEYANLTDHELTVDINTLTKDTYLYGLPTLITIKPGESGKFRIGLNTEAARIYGPLSTKAYVILDGKQVIDDEHDIIIAADIIEDFSKMTTEELQLAPIAQLDKVLDMGVIPSGKAGKATIAIYNNGSNPLMIRRLYCNHDNIILTAPKTAIKSGKKGDIKVEVRTIGKKGNIPASNYNYQIQVITNDPKQPKQIVTLKFEIK